MIMQQILNWKQISHGKVYLLHSKSQRVLIMKSRSTIEPESTTTTKQTERKMTKRDEDPSILMQKDFHPGTHPRSPPKGTSRIPPTPHRESSNAFWSQIETDDWVDYHSPRKPQASSPSRMDYLTFADTDDSIVNSRDSAEPKIELPAVIPSPVVPKPPSKTAIKKAAAAEKRVTKERQAEFDAQKAEYARTFLEVLDRTVTGGKVLELAKSGGGVPIVWSRTLTATAGRAFWSTLTDIVPGESESDPPSLVTRHCCKIELAERLITNEYRLLNTLTHEYCHLANFMISKVRGKPHGDSFQRWGRSCAEAMKNHPLYGGQIHVTTKHSYSIVYKYVWSCVGCKAQYGRHSKSINTLRARCGVCRGTLEQVKPKPRKASKKTETSPEAQEQ